MLTAVTSVFWSIPDFSGIKRFSQKEKIHKKGGSGSSLPSLFFTELEELISLAYSGASPDSAKPYNT